jgi:hypothetical protein
MKQQKGMTFWSLLVVIAAAVLLVLVGMKVAPAYIEFWSVKKIISAMAKDPATENMSVKEIRESFDRRATIDYVTVIHGSDLDISKNGNQVVVEANYSVKTPIFFNLSACMDFSASTARR